MGLIRNFEPIILTRQAINKEVITIACKSKGGKTTKKGGKKGGCKK